jgi:hypothetical protein
VEYSVLVAAAIMAVVAVTHYARMCFQVHALDIEEELSGRP